MITYNDIYESARKERYSEQLQPIPKNFVVEVSNYIRDKKEMTAKDDEFSDIVVKTKKQLENAITLFKELMLRRRRKILNLVLVASEIGISKQDFENMLQIEKELFEGIMKSMDIGDKKLNGLLTGNEKLNEPDNTLVVFLENVEEFLDMEGNTIGPFAQGDVANIPNDVAKILVDGIKVEVMEK
jgi:DNA replication initiation complex subunit (GINS family)